MLLRSLFCLVGVLALAGVIGRADSDDMIGGPPAVQPKPPLDALGRYKQYVYRVVGAHWYPAIYTTSVPRGRIHLSFTIHSDGKISNITVLEGKDQSVLIKIGTDALVTPAPYQPFGPDLLKQVGEKYTDDFTFSTMDKK